MRRWGRDLGQCHGQVRGWHGPQCCPHLLVEIVSSPSFFFGGNCTSLSKDRVLLAYFGCFKVVFVAFHRSLFPCLLTWVLLASAGCGV